MNILLIGGTGFIGQFLTRALLKEKHNVTIFSRDEHKQILLKRKLNNPDLLFILGDITKPIKTKNNYDLIINLAASKHVATGEESPMYVVESNIIGVQNIIDFANGKRIIHMSTDKVINPNNVYGMTKYIAEKLLNGYERSTIYRSGNVFGSRGSIVPILESCEDEMFKVCSMSERYYVSVFTVCDFISGDLLPQNFDKYNYLVGTVPAKRINTNDLVKYMRPDLKVKYRDPWPGEKIYQELYIDENKTSKYNELVYSQKEIEHLIKEYREIIKPELIEL